MASGRFYGQVVFIFFCIDAPFRFTTMSAGKEGGREEGGGTRVRGHEGTVGFQDCGIDNLIRALSFKYLKLPKL